ncbi:MAG: MFS transporter [Acidimicrobiia bacterium]
MTGPGTGKRERLLTPQFLTVTSAGALYFLSLGVILPVLPQYVEGELGGDTLRVGIAVGAFAVGAVLLRPYAGRLGDRYGRRILVIVGAFIVSASAALYPLASNLGVLVAARVLGGLGEAAFFVGAGTMIADLAPVARRGEAISYWSVAVYSGLAFGPFLGEVVLDAADYDTVWIVASALALSAGLLALMTRETLTDASRATMLAIEERQPLLNRSALAPGLVLFLGLCGLAGFTELVPLYVKDVGLDDSRLVFLLYGVLILVVRIAGAKLPDRLGSRRAGTAALTLGAAGLAVMAAWASIAGLVLGTILFAAGMSLMYPAMLTLALTGIDDSQRASVVGTVSTFFDLSQGLGALMLGGAAAVTNDQGGFLAGSLLALAGLALLWAGIDPRARRAPVAVHAYDEMPEPEPGT